MPVSTLKREERAFLGKRVGGWLSLIFHGHLLDKHHPPVTRPGMKPRCDAHTGSTLKEHISLFIEEVAGEKDTLRSFICKLFL